MSADTPRSLAQWAASLLDYAPAPVAIIHRAGYRLLYANIAFRQLHAMSPTGTDLSISDLVEPGVARKIEALIDVEGPPRARASAGTVATRTGDRALHCATWPLSENAAEDLSIVVMEMRPETDDAANHAFQVALAQRLLLSALHDQGAAEAAEAAEKAAIAASDAKSGFLSRMSHELRTPLNAIGGYAELIDMGLRGPVTPEQHKDLARIQAAQLHLLGLINSVLNITKLETGRVQFEIAAVRLDSALVAVLDMLSPHLNRQGLVHRHLAGEPPTTEPPLVSADPEKLRQILINLLTNAIKFTASGGVITTWYIVDDDRVSVNVADTGRGIPGDQFLRVFDPFVQIGRRLNTDDHGIGLGLSISRDLARGMGGEITVMSELGVGSTFTLTLDRASTDAPPSP